MLFGGARSENKRHAVAVVRDIIEVLAIVAAGIWAFYVFAYENRIKPAAADPDVNVSASLQRLSTHSGLIAVGIHVQLRNVGTVRAHFLGMAFNVYGERIVPTTPHVSFRAGQARYEYTGFYRTQRRVPVYASAYITQLGDPATGIDLSLDPGTSVDNDRIFYVPQNRFDLLTVAIDLAYSKDDRHTLPSHLAVSRHGQASIITPVSAEIPRYRSDIAQLDIR